MAPTKPEPVHRETQRHHQAFEVWYGGDRDYKKVQQDFSVSQKSVFNWAEWFGWRARADARDVEVERKNAKAAIARKAQMTEDHRKAGELVRKRGVEYLARNPIKDERTALAAVGKGIEIERTAEGLPAWMVAMMGMDDAELAAYIAAAAGTPAAGAGDPDGEGAGAGSPDAGDAGGEE